MKVKVYELKRLDPEGPVGVFQRAAKSQNFHVAYGSQRNLAKLREAAEPIDALWRSRPISVYLGNRVIDDKEMMASPTEKIKPAPEGLSDNDRDALDCLETWKAGENAFLASLNEDVDFAGYKFSVDKLPDDIGEGRDLTLTEDFARVVARLDLLKV